MNRFLNRSGRTFAVRSYLFALLFISMNTLAQSVEVPARPQVFNKVFDFDRETPIQLDVWENEFVSYSGETLTTYAAYCHSADDPTTGACPVQDTPSVSTPIRLRFREKRSGLTVDLVAEGKRRNLYRYRPEQFVESGLSNLTWVMLLFSDTTFTLYIPPGEASKLPTGGIWESTLNLKLVRGETTDDRFRVDTPVPWTVNITLRVTDRSHIQLYLPEFGDAEPRIDLALRGHPHAGGPGSSLSGSRVIDACLYDGYNSQSQRYEITASDPQSATNAFHVRHESPITPGDASEQIAYRVFAPDPSTGAPHEFLSGQKNTFQGVNTAGWRMVRLPFNPFPVVCTPWPITLETPAFPSNEKHAGQYSGVLRIEFTPSTTSP